MHSFGGGASSFKDVMIMSRKSGGSFDFMVFSPLRFVRPVRQQDIDKNIVPHLYNGQLIYNAYGMDSWKDEVLKVIEELRKDGFDMTADDKGIVWPEYWPANMKNLGEFVN